MRGHTLLELVFVLLLLGVAIAAAVPSARRLADRTAVAAAREALVGLFSEARAAAVERGGAVVRVEAAPARAEVRAQGDTLRRVEITAEFGVALELGGGGPHVELGYDPLGLGRVASQTILLRRGDATTGLVVSAYGRVRRR